MAHFYELFGDNVLDELADPVMRWFPVPEQEIEAVADAFERQLLSTLPKDHPNIKNTRAYLKGQFAAISAGEEDLSEAGYRMWRYEK